MVRKVPITERAVVVHDWKKTMYVADDVWAALRRRSGYSFAGAFPRLVAPGMPFGDALAAVTVNPCACSAQRQRSGRSSSGRLPI